MYLCRVLILDVCVDDVFGCVCDSRVRMNVCVDVWVCVWMCVCVVWWCGRGGMWIGVAFCGRVERAARRASGVLSDMMCCCGY